MFKRIQLFLLKIKLGNYERDAKGYAKQGAENNWYYTNGISDLKQKIDLLKKEINVNK